ncbi:MAG: serine protease AprX [Cyclobacteriaceae bacterium]|jgi:hypothetical protein
MARISFLIFLLILVTDLTAQINRYALHFIAKDTAEFLQSEATDYLSLRAISRREKQNIAITIEDYPVTKEYVQQLREANIDVFYTSRWKNCAIVQVDEADLSPFDFIDSIEYIANGIRLSLSSDRVNLPLGFKEPSRVEASTDFQNDLLGTDIMHSEGFRGEDMLIAVFDDGFEGVNEYEPFAHLFTNDQILSTWNFVTHDENVYKFDDHGTKVLTSLAANYNGEINTVIGNAPNADYLLLLTEDIKSEYRVEEYNWLLAAEFADSLGADIINGSLGYSTFTDSSMDYKVEDLDGKTALCTQAANIASSKGILVVISAGNEGNSSWKKLTAPADAFNVLSVGSVTTELNKSSFSSFGPSADGRIKPDVSALGSLATIMLGNGIITTGNGTSFSSPQIAGLAAGVWQANPTWTNTQVMEAIRFSSTKAVNPNNELGYGIPNYTSAVSGVRLSVEDILNDKIKVYPNPILDNKILVDLSSNLLKRDIKIRVIDLKGNELYKVKLNKSNRPKELEINFNEMDKGTYFLILETQKFNKTVKLIKL